MALKQVEGTAVVAYCEAKSCLVLADLTDAGLLGWLGPPIHLGKPWHQPLLKACKDSKSWNYLISKKSFWPATTNLNKLQNNKGFHFSCEFKVRFGMKWRATVKVSIFCDQYKILKKSSIKIWRECSNLQPSNLNGRFLPNIALISEYIDFMTLKGEKYLKLFLNGRGGAGNYLHTYK